MPRRLGSQENSTRSRTKIEADKNELTSDSFYVATEPVCDRDHGRSWPKSEPGIVRMPRSRQKTRISAWYAAAAAMSTTCEFY